LSEAVVAAAASARSSPAAAEQAQPHVQVAACAADCHHRLANGWCHNEVCVVMVGQFVM
jgi:hypothetical protein